MLTGLIILEDLQIQFTLHNAKDASVTVCDGASGQSKTVECTCEELAASIALAIGSDKMFGASNLYPVAEKLQEKLMLNGSYALRMIQ